MEFWLLQLSPYRQVVMGGGGGGLKKKTAAKKTDALYSTLFRKKMAIEWRKKVYKKNLEGST